MLNIILPSSLDHLISPINPCMMMINNLKILHMDLLPRIRHYTQYFTFMISFHSAMLAIMS